MDLQVIFDQCYSFYLRYPVFCYVAAGVFLLLLLWKPFKILKAALLALVLAAILAVCLNLISSLNTGMGVKEKAIHRTEKAIGK